MRGWIHPKVIFMACLNVTLDNQQVQAATHPLQCEDVTSHF